MCPFSAVVIMANEWLVKHRKHINTCPDGTKISEYACEKRIQTLPHRHVDRGTPSISQYFVGCRSCSHYHEPVLTKEETRKRKKEMFTRNDQDRINRALSRRENEKRDLL